MTDRPDPASAAQRQFASLDRLFSPRSVAVIGASAEPQRIGGRPIASMLAQGYRGTLLPVNPHRGEVQGLRAYPSIASLPVVPDAAVVAVPGDAAVRAVSELARAGTRAAIVFTAGFAETGDEGRRIQERMAGEAQRHGMRLLGPNALGVFNARIGYYAFFSASFEGGYPLPGRIGIASQSGAFGSHMFTLARNRGMGTPVCITTGNESDVTVGDAIGWLAEDPDTDVIVAYVEGVCDAARFTHALELAHAARKPVVLMKVGRSAVGGQAAQSHTAAIAGDDAVFNAVLAEYGVARADNCEELLDIAYAATRRIFPAGNTLGVISVSSGAGIQISDAAEAVGLPMPPMSGAAQQQCKALLPFASPLNPIDVTAQILNDMALVGRFTDVVADQGGYRSMLAFLSQVGGSRHFAPLLCEQLGAARARHPDRLWVVSAICDRTQAAAYEAQGLLVFEELARAVRAIAALGRLGDAFARPAAAEPPVVEKCASPAAGMDEAQAKQWLAAAGIAIADEQVCASADEAAAAAQALGFPVVMKIVSPDIVHKSEVQGVLLDLADEAQVRAAHAQILDSAARLAPQARISGVLVARQLRGGLECLMGIHHDPAFGPVAVFGLGGIHVELLNDVVFRRCPFDEATARDMILRIRAAPILQGARGRPAMDIQALARMLSRLSVMADQHRECLLSVDLNPVIVLPAGQGAFAVDAVIELRWKDEPRQSNCRAIFLNGIHSGCSIAIRQT